MKKICASLNAATCKLNDAVQSKMRLPKPLRKRSDASSTSHTSRAAPAHETNASHDEGISYGSEFTAGTATVNASAQNSGTGSVTTSSCYEGPAFLADLVPDAIGGPPPAQADNRCVHVCVCVCACAELCIGACLVILPPVL